LQGISKRILPWRTLFKKRYIYGILYFCSSYEALFVFNFALIDTYYFSTSFTPKNEKKNLEKTGHEQNKRNFLLQQEEEEENGEKATTLFFSLSVDYLLMPPLII